jgi:transcriptional regulator with XRE-family HTH domain
MQSTLRRPPVAKRSVRAGRQTGGRSQLHPTPVRYRLRVGKEPAPTFPEFLAAAIEADYESDSDFARAAGVSASAVSRWLAGAARPSVRMVEQIAAVLGIEASDLVGLAHPELRGNGQVVKAAVPAARSHPLARELDRMLADNSPLPAAERENLSTVVDGVMDRYRRYLRKRRAS